VITASEICRLIGIILGISVFLNNIRLRKMMKQYPEILKRRDEAEKKINNLKFFNLNLDDLKSISLVPTSSNWSKKYPDEYRLLKINIILIVVCFLFFIASATTDIFSVFYKNS